MKVDILETKKGGERPKVYGKSGSANHQRDQLGYYFYHQSTDRKISIVTLC